MLHTAWVLRMPCTCCLPECPVNLHACITLMQRAMEMGRCSTAQARVAVCCNATVVQAVSVHCKGAWWYEPSRKDGAGTRREVLRFSATASAQQKLWARPPTLLPALESCSAVHAAQVRPGRCRPHRVRPDQPSRQDGACRGAHGGGAVQPGIGAAAAVGRWDAILLLKARRCRRLPAHRQQQGQHHSNPQLRGRNVGDAALRGCQGASCRGDNPL